MPEELVEFLQGEHTPTPAATNTLDAVWHTHCYTPRRTMFIYCSPGTWLKFGRLVAVPHLSPGAVPQKRALSACNDMPACWTRLPLCSPSVLFASPSA
jgi:hypothetical protein